MKLLQRLLLTVLVSGAVHLGASAQVVYVQNGGSVFIQSGAGVTVTGAGLTSVQNLGTVTNNGTTNLAGSFQNDATGDLNLGASSDYNVAGNWINNGDVNADVSSEVEFNGTASQNVTAIGGSATTWKFGRVRMNTPGVVLASNMEVKDGGLLNFSNSSGTPANIITTGASYVELGRGATVTGVVDPGTNVVQPYSYVNGKVRWLTDATTDYRFPIGTLGSGAKQGGQAVEISFSAAPSADNIDYLEATYTDAGGANPNPLNACGAVNPSVYTGSWEFKAFTAANTAVTSVANPYDLSLFPRNIDGSGSSSRGFVPVIRNGGAADFHYVMNNGQLLTPANNNAGESCQNSANANAIVAFGLTGFSEGKGIKDDVNNPFPVELLNFTARPLEKSIQLTWITASENNCSHYDIERSLDAQAFSLIKNNIPGNGTTTKTNVYGHEDDNVQFNQRYYYRLKQYDFNGTFTYSPIREAILVAGDDIDFGVKIYPNPTQGAFFIDLTLLEDATVRVNFYNNLGQQVLDAREDLKRGVHLLNYTQVVNQLAYGTYYAEINVNGERLTKKFIVTQ